jgi:hypothetical protein
VQPEQIVVVPFLSSKEFKMQGDEGGIILSVLFAIFKKRPVFAYTVFVFVIIIFFGTVLLLAKNPDDLVAPILGLMFVLIVGGGQILRSNRQRSKRKNRKDRQTQFDQELLSPQFSPHIQTESTVVETPPEQETSQPSPGDQLDEIPTKQSNPLNPLLAFIRKIISGPDIINTFNEQGPTKSSLAAIEYSKSLILFLILFFIAIVIPLLCIVSSLFAFSSDTDTTNLLRFLLIAPLALIFIFMLLSDLAAIGLAIIAFFKRSEKKSGAAEALLTGTGLLVLQGLGMLGVLQILFPE